MAGIVNKVYWSYRWSNVLQPIRSTTQIWVVTRHQYGISGLVCHTSIRGETVGGVAKRRLSQANTEASINSFEN